MNSKYPLKQAMVTGFTVGIFGLCFFSFADSINHQFSWGLNPMNIRGIAGLIMLVILGIGIFWSMQTIKQANNGALTYKEAIIAGVFTAVTTGVITAFCTFVYCSYLNQGFAAYMLAESKRIMKIEGQSETLIAKNLDDLQKQLTTPAQVMQAFVGQFVSGTIISLILAIIIRTKK